MVFCRMNVNSSAIWVDVLWCLLTPDNKLCYFSGSSIFSSRRGMRSKMCPCLRAMTKKESISGYLVSFLLTICGPLWNFLNLAQYMCFIHISLWNIILVVAIVVPCVCSIPAHATISTTIAREFNSLCEWFRDAYKHSRLWLVPFKLYILVANSTFLLPHQTEALWAVDTLLLTTANNSILPNKDIYFALVISSLVLKKHKQLSIWLIKNGDCSITSISG